MYCSANSDRSSSFFLLYRKNSQEFILFVDLVHLTAIQATLFNSLLCILCWYVLPHNMLSFHSSLENTIRTVFSQVSTTLFDWCLVRISWAERYIQKIKGSTKLSSVDVSKPTLTHPTLFLFSDPRRAAGFQRPFSPSWDNVSCLTFEDFGRNRTRRTISAGR